MITRIAQVGAGHTSACWMFAVLQWDFAIRTVCGVCRKQDNGKLVYFVLAASSAIVLSFSSLVASSICSAAKIADTTAIPSIPPPAS